MIFALFIYLRILIFALAHIVNAVYSKIIDNARGGNSVICVYIEIQCRLNIILRIHLVHPIRRLSIINIVAEIICQKFFALVQHINL